MGEVDSTRDGGAGPSNRLVLRAYVSGLHGWGIATPPKWPVHLELRDPGLIAILRPRRLRTKDVAVASIVDSELRVNSTQYQSGGGFIGGGFGIVGAATGMAVAGALNRASTHRAEHTHLHIIERFPTGAERSTTLVLVIHTPVSLLELLNPAIGAWSQEWVRQTLAGTIRPFRDPDDLQGIYRQIDQIRTRGLITPDQAVALASHHSQPLITELSERLTSGQVHHDELPQLIRDLDDLLGRGHVNRQQADTLRRLIRAVPTPEVPVESAVARQQLITELVQLRRTGAITEQELQDEISRLRRD